MHLERAIRTLCIGLTAATLGAGVAGCGDGLAPEDVIGVWELESVNGDPVPGIVTFNSGTQYEFEYERYTIRADGACWWAVKGRQVGAADWEFMSTPNGQYTLDPEARTITATVDATIYEFSVSGTQMTIVRWGRQGLHLTAFPDAMVYRLQ